ncbi:phosphate ABC transporter substrate-binding protein [Pseudomonas aeruginosa]
MKSKVIALALASLLASAVAHADVAVIVNAAEAAAPSKGEVSSIFLGRSKALEPVDQAGWNPTKDKFYSAVTSKNEASLKSYWSGMVFTGKGQPPAEVADDAQVVARVAGKAGTIGYVDSSAVNAGVKVLFTLP